MKRLRPSRSRTGRPRVCHCRPLELGKRRYAPTRDHVQISAMRLRIVKCCRSAPPRSPSRCQPAHRAHHAGVALRGDDGGVGTKVQAAASPPRRAAGSQAAWAGPFTRTDIASLTYEQIKGTGRNTCPTVETAACRKSPSAARRRLTSSASSRPPSRCENCPRRRILRPGAPPAPPGGRAAPRAPSGRPGRRRSRPRAVAGAPPRRPGGPPPLPAPAPPPRRPRAPRRRTTHRTARRHPRCWRRS